MGTTEQGLAYTIPCGAKDRARPTAFHYTLNPAESRTEDSSTALMWVSGDAALPDPHFSSRLLDYLGTSS